MKNTLVLVLFAAATLVTAQTLTVASSLASSPQFRAFYDLSAPIHNQFAGPRPLTVFAPTNLAVQQFLQSLPPNYNNTQVLRSVLLYHVAPGYILLENITDASPILAFNGGYINVTLVGTSVGVDNYAVILGQFPQVNGNIFTINRVLRPPGVSFEVQTSVATSALPTSQATSVATSEATSFATSEASSAVQPPPQFGPCNSQLCCSSRAFPNILTGDGYLEFNPICNDGGLHCDDDSGCLICHDPAIQLNIFNRPLCNVSTVEPYAPCGDQACCTARMTPNAMTGYGYLEFVQSCTGGGINCFDETGCIDCYNPIPGTTNFLSRPVCSPEAIASFGFAPQTSAAASTIVATGFRTESGVVTEASTVTLLEVATSATVAAKRDEEAPKSTATAALPAFFGALLLVATTQ